MKKILFLTVLLSAATAFADDAKNEWHNTTLSDATIKKIQDAKYQYKKCVSDEMQKNRSSGTGESPSNRRDYEAM